jgi:hypothetical protein
MIVADILQIETNFTFLSQGILGHDSELEEFGGVEFSELTDKLDFSRLNVADSVRVEEPRMQVVVAESKAVDKAKDWQIALAGREKNEQVIKLNKIMESIRRVDLPKFQSELHQVCQYGSDAGLLQLYSAELDVSLNKQTNGLGRFCVHECCVKGSVVLCGNTFPVNLFTLFSEYKAYTQRTSLTKSFARLSENCQKIFRCSSCLRTYV